MSNVPYVINETSVPGELAIRLRSDKQNDRPGQPVEADGAEAAMLQVITMMEPSDTMREAVKLALEAAYRLGETDGAASVRQVLRQDYVPGGGE